MKLKKKKIFLIIAIFIVSILIFYIFTQPINAISSVNQVTSFLKPVGKTLKSSSVFVNVAATFLAFLQVAVTGIAIISFTVVGIQYFTTAAVEAKAVLKQRLFNVFVGGVIAFGALQFVNEIFLWLNR